MSLSPVLEQGLFVEALIALLVLRRTFLISQGTRYSEARISTSVVLYALLLLVVVAEDYFLFPLSVLAGYGALCAAVAVVMALHARGAVEFLPGPGGSWKYRLPMLVGVVYVGLFVARTVLTLVYAPQLLDFSSPTGPLSSTAVLAVGVVDGLFAGSTGLLFGRSAGVIMAYRSKGLERPPGTAPLPHGPSPGSPPDA